MTPCISPWMRQAYANVPAVSKVFGKLIPGSRMSEPNDPSAAVTVWGDSLTSVQTTVVPMGTLSDEGTNARSTISMACGGRHRCTCRRRRRGRACLGHESVDAADRDGARHLGVELARERETARRIERDGGRPARSDHLRVEHRPGRGVLVVVLVDPGHLLTEVDLQGRRGIAIVIEDVDHE